VKLALRPYQEKATDFLYERDRAMILAPVGAGKTAITLTAMDDLIYDGAADRFLVLAPKRVCTSVWPVEGLKWALCLNIGVAVGTSKQRQDVLHDQTYNVVVMNYDNLQWLVGQDLSSFDAIVFDELTKLKNPSGKRFKALMRVIEQFKIRWGLTGSFTSNGLEDVFGQCKVVDEKLLGRAKGAFLQQYFVCTNRDFGDWSPRKGALESVMQRIKPATFVLEPGEYRDKLPPCHVVEMRCGLFTIPPRPLRQRQVSSPPAGKRYGLVITSLICWMTYSRRINMPIRSWFISLKKSWRKLKGAIRRFRHWMTWMRWSDGIRDRLNFWPFTQKARDTGLTYSTEETIWFLSRYRGPLSCTSRPSDVCIVPVNCARYGCISSQPKTRSTKKSLPPFTTNEQSQTSQWRH